MLNDRIIFDGHADSRQECETITLMCDNLAKSKDFKTVRYESGYAEFEKVGKTEELKFAVPAIGTVTVVFDSHITKVENTYGSVTTSGDTLSTSDAKNPETFIVTLENGYVINTVVLDNGDAEAYGSLGSIGETSFTVYPGYGAIGGTITITSKIPAPKQTIDVSTLSGWANLATGNHQITIKTKASGYVDSAVSNAVTVSKAASGHKVYISGSQDTTMGGYAYYSTDNGATWEPLAGGYGWSATNELVGTFTQIKFEIEADADKMMPSCDLSSTALGLSLHASNGETQISDNYKLTEDITDLTFEAYGP